MKITIPYFFTFIFICFLLIGTKVYCATVGYDYAAEEHWVFSGIDNDIKRSAIMDNGFSLQDSSATCSFDSMFPLRGALNLNEGSLYLERDLICGSDFTFGSGGRIRGAGYAINFPCTNNGFEIPGKRPAAFSLIDEQTMGDDVYSVDWSYDSNYLAAGSDLSGTAEFIIYSFDGSNLSQVASQELGEDVNSVRWHPNSYYVIIGTTNAGGTELKLYYFNTTTESLSLSDEVEVGNNVRAVSWSKDGNYLAVGGMNDTVAIFSFSSGTLTYVTKLNLPANSIISSNAIDWNSTGDYIAVGCKGFQDRFYILSFNGTSLAVQDSLDIDVRGVSWRRNDSLIAVALFGTPWNIRIFDYSGGTLTEQTSAQVSESVGVYSVDWSPNGDYLAIGRDCNTGTEFRIYSFNELNVTLNYVFGKDVGSDVDTVRWSSDGFFLAYGSALNEVVVYGNVVYPVYFYDTTIVLNTDVYFTTTVFFDGDSSIIGNGHRLECLENSFLFVNSGSQLTLRNMSLIGLSGENIGCEDDSACLHIKNCELVTTGSFSFTKGSILFDGDIVISGTNQFVYESSQTSTIGVRSSLTIGPNSRFAYNPSVANRDLLYMADKSSYLYIDGGTLYSTTTGMRLTRGTLILDNAITLSSDGVDPSESICFGNGNASDDLDIRLLSGAAVDVYGGLYENNVD